MNAPARLDTALQTSVGTPAAVPLSILACVIVAFAMQSLFIPIDADVSWLITVAERVLAGDRLYVEIFEVNPPASVWLYLPQVWLAELTGLRPEAMIVLVTVIAILLSLAFTLKLLGRYRGRPETMALAMAFTLLVLPGGLFAQREHYAVIFALPALVTIALLADRKPPGAAARAVAGLCAGIVCIIKPPFVLAFCLPAAWSFARSRTLGPLLVPTAVAAAVGILYAVAVILAAPEYLDHLDLLAKVYVPMREQWWKLAVGSCVGIPVACAGLAMFLKARVPSVTMALLLGMAGFAIAALIQGKGYANHGFPATALGLLALLWMLARAAPDHMRRRVAALAVAALTGTQFYAYLQIVPPHRLVEAVRDVAPERPSVMTLGTELATGHPVTRLVDGKWAGTRAALFTAAGVRFRRGPSLQSSERQLLERWYREDLHLFARDAERSRPDVILVERDDWPWIAKEAVLMQAMQRYRYARRAGDIEVWLRR